VSRNKAVNIAVTFPLRFTVLPYAPFDTEEIHMALCRCCNTTTRSRRYQGPNALSPSTYV